MRRLDRIESVFADVDSDIHDYLRSLEKDDSLVYGNIIDVSTIDGTDPLNELSFEKPQLVSESKSVLETIIQSGKYTELIVVAVELPSNGVFLDFYTYSGSSVEAYQNIESLAMSLGVDRSSVHHLVGERVPVARVDNRLRIVEQKTHSRDPTVTRIDYVFPLIIAGLLTPLIGLIGWYSSVSTVLAVGAGVLLSSLLYGVLLYFWLAVKREHPVIGLQSMFVSDHIDKSESSIDTSVIGDVENATVVGFGTFAPSSESGDKRTVLYNFYIKADVRPVGEVKIPIKSPATTWTGSVAKRAVYEVAPSVNELDRSFDKLLPVTLSDDGYVRVDESELSEPIKPELTFKEQLADSYVRRVNNLFSVPTRTEYFDM